MNPPKPPHEAGAVTPLRVLVLALLMLLFTGSVFLSEARRIGWQQEQQQLQAQQAQLEKRLEGVVRYRQLLRQLEAAASREEFYLVVYGGLGQGTLRWQDRTVRRFGWWSASELPPSGRYTLEQAEEGALHWRGPARFTLAPAAAGLAGGEEAACPAEVYCLRVQEENFRVLAAALERGTALLLFPAEAEINHAAGKQE